ncbi:hypothetical protein [Flavobacterium capsici]|uniref:Uncharacterized protein n=1 Tax=Flavobacterium capsici TaxID=3075618 RepID=A0AA96J1S8_9FLAO|nr:MULTISPECIES: hypothetical protein [unclassified Flavobacterium]WNM18702.1 hypothetical protein RN608_11880 [Flavobacterium sp. PMR2A8]WNM22753.1 hypothetical protein RN605_05180 [Flavobacterium sp. PMTSA4]
MEAIWFFPLYIICPLIGFILALWGFLNIRKGKSNKLLFTGLGLLSLPVIHIAFVSLFQLNLSHKIAGDYNLGNEQKILTIYDNGTFVLNKSEQFNGSGEGTWKIKQIETPLLILDFKEKRKVDLLLGIVKHKEIIILTSMQWGNDFSSEFVKK